MDGCTRGHWIRYAGKYNGNFKCKLRNRQQQTIDSFRQLFFKYATKTIL